jgi:hypothetical protein
MKEELESMGSDPDHGYNRVALNAALNAAKRARDSRRRYLRDQGRKIVREKHFKTRHKDALLNLPPWDDTSTLCEEKRKEEEPSYRAYLVDALYSTSGIGGAVLAIERLITHCPQPCDAAPQLVDLYTDWEVKEISLPLTQNQSSSTSSFPSRSPTPSGSSLSLLSSVSHSPPSTVDDTLQRLEELRSKKTTPKTPRLTRGEAQQLVNLRAGKKIMKFRRNLQIYLHILSANCTTKRENEA